MSVKKKFKNRKLLVALLIAALGLSLFAYLHFVHKNSAPTKTVVEVGEDKQSLTAPADRGTDVKTAGGSLRSPSETGLTAPYGSFVSNHAVKLSAPIQNKEQSSCVTTPGAVCYIEFFNGSKTVRLPDRVADSSGLAGWTWDIQETGLSEGSWSIKAIVTLNGQTKTTSDPKLLEISQ